MSRKRYFGQIFQLQCHKNLPLVKRSDIYERVQLVEYYKKILVTYLGHSRNEGEGARTESQGVYVVYNAMLKGTCSDNSILKSNLIYDRILGVRRICLFVKNDEPSFQSAFRSDRVNPGSVENTR